MDWAKLGFEVTGVFSDGSEILESLQHARADVILTDIKMTKVSGLDVAFRVLKNVEGIAFCELTSRDVVRHPLVQKIVEAYEKYEKKAERRKTSHDTADRKRNGRRSG